MELFIQMGHNMQALALEHLEEFDGGTIIISPMNILPNKVKGYATRVHKKKGKVLVDPQLYYPRQYQKKLSQYAYWPKSDITSLEMGQFDTVVEELSKLNNEVEAEAFLLPSITAKKIDDLWNKIQKIIIPGFRVNLFRQKCRIAHSEARYFFEGHLLVVTDAFYSSLT